MLARILGPASVNLIKRMSTDAKLVKIDNKAQNYGTGDSCKDKSLATRLVWVDLEMTGLEIEKDVILEMACIVTDADLNVIAEADDLIIHHPDPVLDSMGQFCKNLHCKTGLTESVRRSDISLDEAERRMVSFIQEHVPPGSCPLAGNTIHVDKEFLNKYMPHFMKHLHYRIIDVSTLKELCRRWYPEDYVNTPVKALKHRALDDIKESITELKYYRKSILK